MVNNGIQVLGLCLRSKRRAGTRIKDYTFRKNVAMPNKSGTAGIIRATHGYMISCVLSKINWIVA